MEKAKILSKEEQDKLFKIYFETKDPEIKKQLVESYIPLVFKFSNKFVSTVIYDRDDLASIGILGLMKAVETFNPYKNIVFSTYATKCIINELKLEYKKMKRNLNVISYYEKIKESQTLSIIDTLKSKSDVESVAEKNSLLPLMMEKLNYLPDNQKEIISRIFFSEEKISQTEIAKDLGMSLSTLCRTEKKALVKLKTLMHLNDKDLEK